MTIERLIENPSIKHMTSIIIEIQQQNTKQIRETHTNPEATHFHSWLEAQLHTLEEELKILEQAKKQDYRPDLQGRIQNPLGKSRDLLNRETFIRDRRKIID